jgi:hypothetical protein
MKHRNPNVSRRDGLQFTAHCALSCRVRAFPTGGSRCCKNAAGASGSTAGINVHIQRGFSHRMPLLSLISKILFKKPQCMNSRVPSSPQVKDWIVARSVFAYGNSSKVRIETSKRRNRNADTNEH